MSECIFLQIKRRNIMNMTKSVTAQVDWKKKIVIIIKSDENTIIPIDEAGNIELTDEIFALKKSGAIDIFEHELEEILSYEQLIALYDNWGNALAIMVGNTANVLGISKHEAKEIIQSAEKHGIICAGHNCTWRIKETKIIKARWSDKARNMQKLENTKKKETPQEIVARFEALAETLEKKNQGTSLLKKKPQKVAEELIEETVEESVEIEEVVEIIPEEPIVKGKQDAEGELRAKLKALEHKAKTFTDWNETVTPWTVNNEINAIKHQLRTLEAHKQGKQYMKEVNSMSVHPPTLPKSITRLTPTPSALSKPVGKSLPVKKKLPR
jgi:hypothetical protein